MKTNMLRFLALSAMLCFLSTAAFAACEAPGNPADGASTVKTAQKAKVEAVTEALKTVYANQTQTTLTQMTNRLTTMENRLIAKLNQWWNRWFPALKNQTKQLNASIINNTRQILSNLDSENMSLGALAQQKSELEAKRQYTPSEEACQFDTNARAVSATGGVATAMTRGYANDFNRLGNNEKGTPATEGMRSLQKHRFDIYRTKFCDGNSNNGVAGCAPGLPMANAHVLPSKTIFGRETINMKDADTRLAIDELLMNITGYAVPDPTLTGAQDSATGKGVRQTKREYITQMDATGALAYMTVADRVMGPPSPYIQAIRQQSGIADPSPTPSKREVRQAMVERLWDPNYITRLLNNPSTITQREIEMKAYSLLMLYDLIEKQEKISTAFAIQTANILDAQDKSRHNVSDQATMNKK